VLAIKCAALGTSARRHMVAAKMAALGTQSTQAVHAGVRTTCWTKALDGVFPAKFVEETSGTAVRRISQQ